MSTHYNTEPPPTATVLLTTTAGPLTISLFAAQTPLTCRNFLQHCLDGTYLNTTFHRIAPGFVIQTGDPTGTGSGGENIYEDREFERYDEHWARFLGREAGEKIVFGDEVHSRLKFSRRGLVGMAKSEEGDDVAGGYGSQWFITLGDVRAELDGRCTMFGRVEGEGIYNVVKIAEGEVVEGSERPVYPERVLGVEVTQWPKGEAWAAMRAREKVVRSVEVVEKVKKPVTKRKAKKGVLSFGDEEEEEGDVVVKPKKAKFNTALIDAPADISDHTAKKTNGTTTTNTAPSKRKTTPPAPPPSKSRPSSSHHSASPTHTHHNRQPTSPDPSTQLPLRNPEAPSHSPSASTSTSPPPHQQHHKPSAPTTADLESQISALKASFRRPTTNNTTIGDASRKQSALEALIPSTSTRGRKRPRPGDTGHGAGGGGGSKEDAKALKMLNAFRARLESAAGDDDDEEEDDDSSKAGKGKTLPKKKVGSSKANGVGAAPASVSASATAPDVDEDDEDGEEEARLCDLHFIANCASCFAADKAEAEDDAGGIGILEDGDDGGGKGFLGHKLMFGKDVLGKDGEWRKGVRNRDRDEDDDGGLVVIDPRVKERELKGKGKGKGRDRGREWDRNR